MQKLHGSSPIKLYLLELCSCSANIQTIISTVGCRSWSVGDAHMNGKQTSRQHQVDEWLNFLLQFNYLGLSSSESLKCHQHFFLSFSFNFLFIHCNEEKITPAHPSLHLHLTLMAAMFWYFWYFIRSSYGGGCLTSGCTLVWTNQATSQTHVPQREMGLKGKKVNNIHCGKKVNLTKSNRSSSDEVVNHPDH